jgi:hypothetical protein
VYSAPVTATISKAGRISCPCRKTLNTREPAVGKLISANLSTTRHGPFFGTVNLYSRFEPQHPVWYNTWSEVPEIAWVVDVSLVPPIFPQLPVVYAWSADHVLLSESVAAGPPQFTLIYDVMHGFAVGV